MAKLPIEIFNKDNARTYGEFLGKRYRDKGIIWIIGGDRSPEGVEYRSLTDTDAIKTNEAVDALRRFALACVVMTVSDETAGRAGRAPAPPGFAAV